MSVYVTPILCLLFLGPYISWLWQKKKFKAGQIKIYPVSQKNLKVIHRGFITPLQQHLDVKTNKALLIKLKHKVDDDVLQLI